MVDYSMSIFTADELRGLLETRWARLHDRNVHGIELDRLAFEMKQLGEALSDRLARDEYHVYGNFLVYLKGEWVGGYYGGK